MLPPASANARRGSTSFDQRSPTPTSVNGFSRTRSWVERLCSNSTPRILQNALDKAVIGVSQVARCPTPAIVIAEDREGRGRRRESPQRLRVRAARRSPGDA